jgi:hypothetical protein
MKQTMTRIGLTLVVVLAIGPTKQAAASLVYVNQVQGNISILPFGLNGGPSGGPIGATISMSDGDDAVVSMNGEVKLWSFRPGGSVLNSGGPGELRVTAVITNATGTLYTFALTDRLGQPLRANLAFLPAFGDGHVTLLHTSVTGFVADADPSVMNVSGGIQLSGSTNTMFDFSGFNSGGLFDMDLHVSGKNFNTLLSTPGHSQVAVQSGLWTMTAAPVPEPTSIALVGISIACLAGYAWRRRIRLAA